MQTIWIEQKDLERRLARNEAFWRGELEDYPLIWVTADNMSADNTRAGRAVPEPATDDELWTNVDYVIESTEQTLARRYYAGDALPVFNPWLGPDQFAAWLGAEMTLKPREFTSWVKPFVHDWGEHPQLGIDPQNKWWKLYLDLLRASAEAGREKWVTGYPDLHTGIDALSALRGPENLSLDLMTQPEAIVRAMDQTTVLWKEVVDTVSDIVLPAGQGTSNWTMGWSAGRFLCIGQNDYSCMIGTDMFREHCLRDNIACCNHVDCSLYHLDGPGAIRHVPTLLGIERLNCIQWIQGAGNPHPSQWLELLKQIQEGGKSVQLYYGPSHGDDADLLAEARILCRELDPSRLFIWACVKTAGEADALVEEVRRSCLARK